VSIKCITFPVEAVDVGDKVKPFLGNTYIHTKQLEAFIAEAMKRGMHSFGWPKTVTTLRTVRDMIASLFDVGASSYVILRQVRLARASILTELEIDCTFEQLPDPAKATMLLDASSIAEYRRQHSSKSWSSRDDLVDLERQIEALMSQSESGITINYKPFALNNKGKELLREGKLHVAKRRRMDTQGVNDNNDNDNVDADADADADNNADNNANDDNDNADDEAAAPTTKKKRGRPRNENKPLIANDIVEQHFFLGITTKEGLDVLRTKSNGCIFLDSTEGLNQYGYSTYIVVARSAGRLFPIGFFITSTQTAGPLKDFLSWLFGLAGTNPRRCVVDADPAEKKALEDLGVQVILCFFHFKQAVRKRLLGHKLSKDKVAAVLSRVDGLHAATSEAAFDELYVAFIQWLTAEGLQSFADYFTKQWHSRRRDWAVYAWGDHSRSDRTNNILERFNRTIKHEILQRRIIRRMSEAFSLIVKDIIPTYRERMRADALLRTSSNVQGVPKAIKEAAKLAKSEGALDLTSMLATFTPARDDDATAQLQGALDTLDDAVQALNVDNEEAAADLWKATEEIKGLASDLDAEDGEAIPKCIDSCLAVIETIKETIDLPPDSGMDALRDAVKAARTALSREAEWIAREPRVVDLVDLSCSCPAGKRKTLCKHVYAVFLLHWCSDTNFNAACRLLRTKAVRERPEVSSSSSSSSSSSAAVPAKCNVSFVTPRLGGRAIAMPVSCVPSRLECECPYMLLNMQTMFGFPMCPHLAVAVAHGVDGFTGSFSELARRTHLSHRPSSAPAEAPRPTVEQRKKKLDEDLTDINNSYLERQRQITESLESISALRARLGDGDAPLDAIELEVAHLRSALPTRDPLVRVKSPHMRPPHARQTQEPKKHVGLYSRAGSSTGSQGSGPPTLTPPFGRGMLLALQPPHPVQGTRNTQQARPPELRNRPRLHARVTKSVDHVNFSSISQGSVGADPGIGQDSPDEDICPDEDI
jgi:hypothetical protein